MKFSYSVLGLGVLIGGCALVSGESRSKNSAAGAAHDETPDSKYIDDVGAPSDLPSIRVTPVDQGTVSIPGPNGDPIKISYAEVGGVRISEGDIVIPKTIESATSIGRAWPGGIVPYVIDTTLPSNDRATAAMQEWTNKTRITFVPRTNEVDYVNFRASNGCSAAVGQQGGQQFVNLNTGEAATSVAAVGVDRSTTPARVVWLYKRGYATAGDLTFTDSISSHFRVLLPPGKAMAAVIDIAFASNGHMFTFFDDGTYSEGTAEDTSAYAQPKPYAVATGHVASDAVGFAIDASDAVYAYYSDGTYSSGTAADVAATTDATAFALAPGKAPTDVAKVDFINGAFVVFYNEVGAAPDGGGAPPVVAMTHTTGTAAALAATAATPAKTFFTGNCGVGEAVHEIGHVVGLFHEQTRFDRDDHVNIIWANIDPASQYNFEKHPKVVGTDTGDYDFGSIMHYAPTAFSINGQATITKKDGSSFVQNTLVLSDGDVGGVAAMYGAKP